MVKMISEYSYVTILFSIDITTVWGNFPASCAFHQQQKFGNWFWVRHRTKQFLLIWDVGKN